MGTSHVGAFRAFTTMLANARYGGGSRAERLAAIPLQLAV
jgi:hypothetical protein